MWRLVLYHPLKGQILISCFALLFLSLYVAVWHLRSVYNRKLSTIAQNAVTDRLKGGLKSIHDKGKRSSMRQLLPSDCELTKGASTALFQQVHKIKRSL